jgi:hypothetical protein
MEMMFEDVSAEVLADEIMTDDIHYWADKQEELGYVSRWSLGENTRMETKLFSDKQRHITYTVYARDVSLDDLLNGTAQRVQFSTFATNGTVAALYRAGEFLIKCAIEQEGAHHIFIEDFEAQDDGSFAMVTGS